MRDTLNRLETVIQDRRTGDPASSYVAKISAAGTAKIAQKLGEEATEAVIAAMEGDRQALTGEAADLIFHLFVLLADAGVPFDAVLAELDRRAGVSGLVEKAARTS
jgi:phosphoribosyl-ATP pyrophosphohydrolase